MELKVWVEGVVRVVCGLMPNTSCQDVVIALAQAIGQTGRYVLILKLRGIERQLVADDCPLQSLAQLGQLAAEVQFILRRTGPSLSDGPNGLRTERLFLLPRHSDPKPLKHREPQKALTFSLGPSMVPRRTKANRAWSPSPRASPEPISSPVSFLDPVNPVKVTQSYPSKEEVFRQILQQQERLGDLEMQLQVLERETGLRERERSSNPMPALTLGLEKELEALEVRLRENEIELMHGKSWEQQLHMEMDKEQDMKGCLAQICSSVNDYSYRLQELLARSAHLGQDILMEAQKHSSWPGTPQIDESLVPLRQELHYRLQQGEEQVMSLRQTEGELQAAEAELLDSWQEMEELNKELRQCNLQQFIQQTGVSPGLPITDLPLQEHTQSLPAAMHYLCNAGIQDDEQADTVTVC
ncbi:ras association domain-containing protein 8-like [Lampris incognitus]|uniref:ras association domain-containing protein 8-like n=1 Tax=Lampris incognitus TaxID=2546036 RepID=UPI0024B4D707|nr:ras association domain-containing protein 8-like [Lampris incognitus]